MASKGIVVSPSLLAGLVVVILGLAAWTIVGSMDKDSDDAVATATPTATATATPSASPSATATATPKPTPAAGWLRYNLPAVGVSFDYPKTLSSVKANDEDFAKIKEGTGHQVSATFKTASASDAAYSLTLLSESTDFTTGLGRGASFIDYDGFEKSGTTYNTYAYSWEDGKKHDASPLLSSYTAETITTTGGFEALLVKGGATGDESPVVILKEQYAAIVMLPAATGYHAVSLMTGVDKMSYADFTTLVKSFDLTN